MMKRAPARPLPPNDPFSGARLMTPEAIDRLKAPTAFRALCRLLAHLDMGRLQLTIPNGERIVFAGSQDGPDAQAIVKNWRMARRILLGGGNGAAESFLAGDWESPDVTAVLSIASLNQAKLARFLKGSFAVRQVHRLMHLLNRNTRRGARKNILSHYDLGNAFYERWLDGSMTYSAARFESPDQDLEEAQLAKYRALADRIGLKPGERVLEIGCGWGGFAEYAARERGAHVTGLTISDAQLAYARRRMDRLGLNERVTLKLQDYRDEIGVYDKIVSIEMFEAVGREYWPVFFGKLRDCLVEGGKAGLQIITIDDDRFNQYAKRADFIQRYVFPGGMLPSPSLLKQEIEKAGLQLRDVAGFGHDYAETLKRWRDRFLDAWDDIRTLGFDDRFQRLWRYYLSYCEAGFRTDATDVKQIVLSRH